MSNVWTREIRFPFERRDGWGNLLLLLTMSFLLKAALLASTAVITNDGPTYIREAQAVLEGNFYLVEHGAYPFLIAVLSFLVPDLVFAGQLISLFASVLTLAPLYLLMQRAWDSRVAFWGCLAFVFSPGLNRFSVNVMRDPCFLFFIAFAIFFTWTSLEHQRLPHFLLAAVFSLISILIRLEGIIFPFVFLALALIFIFLKKERAGKIVLGTGVFAGTYLFSGALAFFIVDPNLFHILRSNVMFYRIENILKEGLFDYSPLIKPKLKELETLLPGGNNNNNFIDIVRDHIRSIYLMGICVLFAKVLYFPYFYASLFGLWVERQISKNNLLFPCFFAAYLIVAFNFNLRRGFLEERYIYVPVLLALPWVGIGLVKIVELLRKSQISKPLVPLFMTIICAFPVADTFAYLKQRQTVAFKQTGEWLSQQESMNGATLIGSGRKIPFYAGRSSEFVDMTFKSFDTLKERAKGGAFDLISIETESDDADQIPEFPGYEQLIRFDDGNYTGLIFKRHDLSL